MMAFTPQTDEHKAALVAKPLFDELIECWLAAHPEKTITVDWGPAYRGTIVYYEPTIYEMFPQPDPLTVAEDST